MESFWRLFSDLMTTLTITDAKKNLGKWLQAASRGEDVVIISAADIIALRKVRVEAADYAMTEYGVTPGEIERFTKRVDADFAKLKKTGKVKIMTAEEVRAKIRP